MSFAPADQILSIAAWLLALIEFILALYVLLLNARHIANRYVSALLLLMTINNIALSLLLGADNATEAALPTLLLAAVATAASPWMLLVAVVLLKPQWLRGQWRGIWWPLYGLVLLPILLILVDLGLGTRLWYTGLNAEAYAGGFAQMGEYVAGGLSVPLKMLSFRVISVMTIILLLYIALRDKKMSPLTRRLAWLLLGAQIVTVVIQLGFHGLLVSGASTLATSTILALAYAYAGFQQMISERRLQRGKLQTRLTLLTLVVTVPVLVVVVAFVNASAGALIEQAVVQQPGAELLGALQQFRQVSWAVLVVGVMLILCLAWLTIRQALRPIGTLTETAIAIAAGDLDRVTVIESEDEIGALARTFNSMTVQLRQLIGSLEQRVADRTRELEQRSAYLEASAEVGRAASSILETEELIRQVVELIRERFGLYYVGLFLVEGEWAVLRAGTGEAGRAMLTRGHRIRIGEGMIGWSIANVQARVALEVGEDSVRLGTVELPETRSEAAIPLRSRGQVLGALTVQHTQPGIFDQDTIIVLQTMGDQVAVALDNARLFTASQEALERTRRAYGGFSRQAWIEQLSTRPDWGYRYVDQSIARAEGDWQPEMLQAAQTGQSVLVEGEGEPSLAIPIKIRDQVVGTLGLRKAETDELWTDEETALLEMLTEQLGTALESARLYQDTRRRATREQLVGEVTARMRETLDVETVLKTAAREIGEALGLAALKVQLGVAEMTPLPSEPQHNQGATGR